MRRMGRRLLLALVLVLVASACGGAAVQEDRGTSARPDDGSFVAMTFNIRYGTADDGADAWDKRKDHLLRTILDAAPAVLGVQEALDFQVRFLEEGLPHHRRVGQGRDGGTRGEHACLYIDSRRMQIVDHGDFWLSETPEVAASVGWDAALTRMCTWARVKETGSGAEFMVWNMHFDHMGKTARLRSARLVAARAAAVRIPQLLLGDLNAGEADEPQVALRAAGFVDTWRELHPQASDAGTFHAFRGGTDGEKIDQVMRSAGWRTLDAAILDRPAANGRWPSDHHPVVARLVLAPGS